MPWESATLPRGHLHGFHAAHCASVASNLTASTASGGPQGPLGNPMGSGRQGAGQGGGEQWPDGGTEGALQKKALLSAPRVACRGSVPRVLVSKYSALAVMPNP